MFDQKRQKWLRIPSLFLAVLLLTGMAGCGGSGAEAAPDASPASTAAETPSAAATTGTNEFGWEIPAETLVIDTFFAQSSYAPPEEEKAGEKNMQDYLLEHFNVEWRRQSTAGDVNEAINLMLASGDYPEILYGSDANAYNFVLKFQALGKAQELTPYVDTLLPDMKAELGEMYPLFLDDDNKLFYIPRGVGGIMEQPDNSAHFRYDEWLALGSPDMSTPEAYYNTINAALEANPTTPNGETRYAMSFYDQGDASGLFTLNAMFGIHRDWKIGDDGSFTYWVFTEEAKNASKWANQFHRDGTLDPDAFINKFDDWKAKFSAQRIVGAVGGQWIGDNAGTEVWQVMEPDWNDDMRVVCVNVKDPSAEAAYMTGKRKFGGTTIITDKATNLEGILKWVNFQATEPGKGLTAYGVPNGVPTYADPSKTFATWTMNPDGTYFVNDSVKEALLSETWDYMAARVTGELISPLFYSVNRWKDGNTHFYVNQMWVSENKWRNKRYTDMAGTIYDESPWVLRTKTDTQIQEEISILEAWKTFWPLVITSNTDEEFEANWKNLQDAVTAAGIEDYTQAVMANYQKNMEKMASFSS